MTSARVGFIGLDFSAIYAFLNARRILAPEAIRACRGRRSVLSCCRSASRFAGCASYSGIQGEAQALAPQSLAFYQDRTAATGRARTGGPGSAIRSWNTLMPQALQGNPSLRAAEARVRAARALADAAGASLYRASTSKPARPASA